MQVQEIIIIIYIFMTLASLQLLLIYNFQICVPKKNTKLPEKKKDSFGPASSARGWVDSKVLPSKKYKKPRHFYHFFLFESLFEKIVKCRDSQFENID